MNLIQTHKKNNDRLLLSNPPCPKSESALALYQYLEVIGRRQSNLFNYSFALKLREHLETYQLQLSS